MFGLRPRTVPTRLPSTLTVYSPAGSPAIVSPVMMRAAGAVLQRELDPGQLVGDRHRLLRRVAVVISSRCSR